MPLLGPQSATPSEHRGAIRDERFEMRTLYLWHEPVEQPNKALASVVGQMPLADGLARRFRKLLVQRTRYLIDERGNVLIPAVPDWFFSFE